MFSGSYSGGGFDVVGSPLLLSPSFQHRQRCPSESDYSSMSETSRSEVCYHIIIHLVDLKQQHHLKVGTDKPKLNVKMQSVSNDDVQKRLLEKPRFELDVKGVLSRKMLHLPAGRSRSLG